MASNSTITFQKREIRSVLGQHIRYEPIPIDTAAIVMNYQTADYLRVEPEIKIISRIEDPFARNLIVY